MKNNTNECLLWKTQAQRAATLAHQECQQITTTETKWPQPFLQPYSHGIL